MSRGWRAKLKGSREVRSKIEGLRELVPDAVNAAVFEEALEIFRESQLRVPVDTGRLRSSGLVAPQGKLRDFFVIISYGTNYALSVHERHPTRSKFLEDPFREATAGMLQRISSRSSELAGLKNRRPRRRVGKKPRTRRK